METSSTLPATPAPIDSPRRLLLRGVRDILPLLPGAIPFGLVYGIAAQAAHIPAWLTQAMSAVIFAGASQFAAVTLVAGGVPVVLLVLTATVLNLRHVLYSASIAPTLQGVPRGWRLVIAYLLTDELYGTVIGRVAGMSPTARRWYIFGAGLTMWITWQLSTLAGLLAGGEIPSSWSLDFAATLTFIALMVPLLSDRSSICAGIVSAVVSILALSLPLKLGIVTAALAGIAAGVIADSLFRRFGKSASTAAAPQGAGTEPGETSATPREERS